MSISKTKNRTGFRLRPFPVLGIVAWALLLLNSCSSQDKPETKSLPEAYSFIVAGHAYGNPNNAQYGLYPPFMHLVPAMNADSSIQFAVLTGDVVLEPTAAYWDSAQADIEEFRFPVHITPGNHDRGVEFYERFPRAYHHFMLNEDLFILLDPKNWQIDGSQKEYLMKTISEDSEQVRNIFIFCHELIWWTPENKFSKVDINWRPHYPGKSNFWEEIAPSLLSLENEVMIFAGDVGATWAVSPYMYYHEKNLTLIASGMGGVKKDNFVKVDIDERGEIELRLIGMKSTELRELEDIYKYRLPE